MRKIETKKSKNLLLVFRFAVLNLLILGCAANSTVGSQIEQSPGVEHPETAGFRVVTREQISPPVAAYNFSLIDQSGEIVSLEELEGSVVMISFLYTHCPEACPLVAANFRSVQDQLITDIDSRELIQVLVTTDPDRDDPDRLRRYTEALGGQWYFLTGSTEDLQKVWDGYSIYHEIRDRTQEIVVFHSYKTFLIDRQGNLQYEFVGVWFPDDILPDIQYLLNQNEE
jgi:protein SCO1/2